MRSALLGLVALWSLGLCAQERFFPDPAATNMANVKSYGAVGDGVTDDTAAIQAAIFANIGSTPVPGAPPNTPLTRIIYFPAGTYLVSKPLIWRKSGGAFSAGLTLQGENSQTTIIKLADNDHALDNNVGQPSFQDSTHPAAVVQTAVLAASGNGINIAFDNYIFDLTINVGQGNPGAIALDFLGNNYCGIGNVRLVSSPPAYQGYAGLSLERRWPGPCLMKNVTVTGFNYGIRAANVEYSVTFENLALSHQSIEGIHNASNVLSIRNLTSNGSSVPVVDNVNAEGMVTILGATLNGVPGSNTAILNSGALYLRNINAAGYGCALMQGTSCTFAVTATTPAIAEYHTQSPQTLFNGPDTSLNLPILNTPEFQEQDVVNNWASVKDFGAMSGPGDSTTAANNTVAIQNAMCSPATTVYFPTGRYYVSGTIHIGGTVNGSPCPGPRVIEGFDSLIIVESTGSTNFGNPASPAALFEIDAPGAPNVAINHVRLSHRLADNDMGLVYVLQNSARPVILRDSAYGAADKQGGTGTPPPLGTPLILAAYQNTLKGTGTLYVEDVSAPRWNILFPQKVFARQMNPESDLTKITNFGTLWILGLKTELRGTNIDTETGGETELLGGFIYPVKALVDPNNPAFSITDAHATLSYVTFGAGDGDFATQVEETQGTTTLNLQRSSLPARGNAGGIEMPLYTSQ